VRRRQRTRWHQGGLGTGGCWVLLVCLAAVLTMIVGGLAGCGRSGNGAGGQAVVLADTSFLADIVSDVAGDRMTVESLVPQGADPHSFEPTPQDAKRLAECRAIVINAVGLIPTVDELIAGSGRSDLLVIDASSGLPGAAEDPHFWLDPLSVITYVDNIVGGLSELDPSGGETYKASGEAYKAELRDLDAWIRDQVETIPADRRLLVTNHESLLRFAARYGFEVVGSIFPTVTGEGSPSAQDMADLIGAIKATGAPAIFLETGANDDLARQIASETGVAVIEDLYTHSLGGEADTYLKMMRWNVSRIVEALR
jgi:manganese/iron transport system substrate-binding protein